MTRSGGRSCGLASCRRQPRDDIRRGGRPHLPIFLSLHACSPSGSLLPLRLRSKPFDHALRHPPVVLSLGSSLRTGFTYRRAWPLRLERLSCSQANERPVCRDRLWWHGTDGSGCPSAPVLVNSPNNTHLSMIGINVQRVLVSRTFILITPTEHSIFRPDALWDSGWRMEGEVQARRSRWTAWCIGDRAPSIAFLSLLPPFELPIYGCTP